MSDLFSIEGKTAVVTGGSRGIGLMIARGFVEAGAKVYISSRKADVCEEVAAELSKVGECVALPADLSTEDECRRLAGAVAERDAAFAQMVEAAYEHGKALNSATHFEIDDVIDPADSRRWITTLLLNGDRPRRRGKKRPAVDTW